MTNVLIRKTNGKKTMWDLNGLFSIIQQCPALCFWRKLELSFENYYKFCLKLIQQLTFWNKADSRNAGAAVQYDMEPELRVLKEI